MDRQRYPECRRLYQTEPGVQVLGVEQVPAGQARGALILVHGLEGSHEAGYMVSLAQTALDAGFHTIRLNMRSCGGAEEVSSTLYHAGLTSDLLSVARTHRAGAPGPLFLAGFSLGGNVVLKLAGELGESAAGLVDGVCAVSAPIDLAACVREISRPANRLYEWRFVERLKARYARRHRAMPDRFPADGLHQVRSVYEFDDRFTAPAFGFGRADNYYATQSSLNFLRRIRTPTLLLQAKDDPMIPFEVFEKAGIERNPALRLVAVDHGGHLGFLARNGPRFWQDPFIVEWMTEQITLPVRPLQR